jgi:hypothetical protein
MPNITGGVGNDTLTGPAGSILYGGPGNDTLTGSGAGTAFYRGNSADYTVERLIDGTYTVTDSVAGRDGVDHVSGLDHIRFIGGSFLLTDRVDKIDVASGLTGLGYLAPQAIPVTLALGSATSLGGASYRLTPDQGSQGGAIWGSVDISHDVIWSGQLYFGTHGGGDGIGFALAGLSELTSHAVGSYGVELGNTFGVRFATWSNWWAGNPGSNFSQFLLNGDLSSSATNFGPYQVLGSLPDGAWHDVKLTWNAAARTLTYTLDGQFTQTKVYDVSSGLLGGGNIAAFGFGASTGGLSNDQRVHVNYVLTQNDGLSIDTGSASGTLVGVLKGIDDRPGDVLSYQIVDGNGHATTDELFEIDNGNELRLKPGVSVDTSVGAEHDLRIKVMTQGGESVTQIVSVAIRVPGQVIDVPGGGSDLTGTAGSDTFVFHQGFGASMIENFNPTGSSHDMLQVDRTVFADWAHLIGAAHQVGSDVMITLDAQNSILLKNVALDTLTSADAHFF